MSFEARVYIQGVGVYAPQENGELHVLFPSQEKAVERKIPDICRHYAVVQFDSRYLMEGLKLDPRIPVPWTTLDIAGLWVRLSAVPEGSKIATHLTEDDDDDDRVPGVPHLPDILDRLQKTQPAMDLNPSLDQSAQPGPSAAEMLRAGLVLDAGILSPYAEYEGLFRFEDEKVGRMHLDRRYSSVLKLELGQVKSFSLHFTPFGSEKPFSLSLTTPWDELEVWIRHFCDLSRPDPDQDLPLAGDEDTDFVLNYALLENLDTVLKACNDTLPVPKVASSWAKGGHIGLESRKCMAASTKRKKSP